MNNLDDELREWQGQSRVTFFIEVVFCLGVIGAAIGFVAVLVTFIWGLL